MSNEIDRSTQGILKQDIMKEEFGWDIPVETVPLPSRGLIYSPDTTLYNRESIAIKAMTAHEEDILTSQAFIKEGTVVNHLISSCVTDKTFNVDDLIIGDRNALMVSIRVTGYGADYNVTAECENCNHKNSPIVNLTSLGIKRLNIKPMREGVNKFEYTLPITKKKVVFRFLNSADERNRNKIIENESRVLNTKITKAITTYLKQSIVSIDGISDRNKINHFVLNMPAFDSRSLRKYINENEPGLDMTSSFVCKNCNHHNNFILPITTEFFWPAT